MTNINILDMVLDLMNAEVLRYLIVVGFGKNVIIFGVGISSFV